MKEGKLWRKIMYSTIVSGAIGLGMHIYGAVTGDSELLWTGGGIFYSSAAAHAGSLPFYFKEEGKRLDHILSNSETIDSIVE